MISWVGGLVLVMVCDLFGFIFELLGLFAEYSLGALVVVPVVGGRCYVLCGCWLSEVLLVVIEVLDRGEGSV